MIVIEGVTKEYERGTALGGIDLRIGDGEMVGLVGPSGAGKSTLLRMINGFIQPTRGRVTVDGRDPARLRGVELRRHRRDVGMIYQQFQLVDRLTAAENAVSGAAGRVPSWRTLIGSFSLEQRREAVRALERVGLGDRADQRVDTLSGGQQQRVAIARTLVQNPSVVLADEPVASLDPGSSERVLALLQSLARQDGRTVVVSLHQVDLARRFCDRVVALNGGRVVIDRCPSAIEQDMWTQLYAAQPLVAGAA